MDKKYMNKLDVMELDKVAGGITRVASPNGPEGNSENPLHRFFGRIGKALKEMWELDNEKPTPKPTPAAPKKPTIDPEEVRRQQREDMKNLNNGFGIPNFDQDFH